MFKDLELINRVKKNDWIECDKEQFDMDKKYKFSYERLLNDKSVSELSCHQGWIKELKEHDGEDIRLVSEEEGIVDSILYKISLDGRTEDLFKLSIAPKWCVEA